jgi:transcriptional regulator with XRE-family HTH domain
MKHAVKPTIVRKTGGHVKGLTIQSLGKLALVRRAKRGIREVAREIGVSTATLSRVERGSTPNLENFCKICKWLRVDPATVLGGRRRKPSRK